MEATRKTGLSLALLLLMGAGCSRSPKATRDMHVERGKQLMASKDYGRAVLEFRTAAKATPDDPEVYYQLGMASRGAGDLVMAAQAFRKTLSLDEKHTGAQLMIAGLMTSTGDKDLLKEAEKRLRTLLETTPVTAEMLNALALTELRMGKTEDAVQSLEQALAKAPQELSSAVMLSLAKLGQKDVAGAEEVLKKACESSPKSAPARLILGRFYYSQGRPKEAEEEVRRALAIAPDYGAALIDLGRIHMAAGRKAEAEAIFKQLSTASQKTYHPVYGLFLFQDGRREEAVKEFERLAKQDPEDRIARARLMSAYGSQNRKADIERVLAEALKKNPRDLEALLQRAEISVASGKYAEAEADINQILRMKPDAAEVRYTLARLHQARGATLRYREELTEALKLNPFLLPVRLELAQALTAANQAKVALDILEETPQSQKDLSPVVTQRNWALWALGDLAAMRKGIDQGVSRERSPDLLIQDGLWKLRNNNAAGARASLEEALKLDPTDILALEGLRQTFGKQQTEALKRIKEFAAQQPKSAPVQQFLGTLQIASGDRAQARAALTAATKADPELVTAELSLIQLDILDRKFDDARTKLQSIVNKNNGLPLAKMWLGQVELIKGNHAGALDQFAKVVDAEPDNARALNNYAYLLAEHANRLDEALKHAEKARAQAPDDPAIADTLGWIYYRKGLYPSAVKHLEAAAGFKDSSVPKYHLAMAYVKAGNREKGRSTYEEAQKANPNLPEAAEARKLLEQKK